MVKISAAVLAAALLSMTASAVAQDAAPDPNPAEEAQTVPDDATVDAQFQCPETLADNDSRIEEYARFLAWAREAHPDWNFRKRLDVRYGLLRRHACAVTLANMASSTKPPFGP